MSARILLLLSALSALSFKWDNFSMRRAVQPPIKAQAQWTVDTAKGQRIKPQLASHSPPLITERMAVQGNAINGIKAYTKDKGRLIWSFKARSGIASPIARHKGNIYFGGADGFFYSLRLKTGQLNWKFWTGSENSGPPLIHKGRVYWTAGNQKMYALSLKGRLTWIYSGPSQPKDFFVRGRPQPAVYKNWIYTSFYRSELTALDKNTGRLKWKKSLSPFHPIINGLKVKGNCLFAPVFGFYLFCLDPLNNNIRWKIPGGSSFYMAGESVIYQSHKEALSALRAFNGKTLWTKSAKGIRPPFFVSAFGKYLAYGSPSYGILTIASSKNGKTLSQHRFGRGLAAPVSYDSADHSVYFLSVDGYLHKISLVDAPLST